LLACYDAIQEGRPILSTVHIDVPQFVPLASLTQLAEAEDCHVLLDEVQGLLSSREYSTLPPEVVTLLLQLRKRRVTLAWTTPTIQRADTVLREITRTVTVCKPLLSVPEPGGWPRLKYGLAKTFEMQAYVDASVGDLRNDKGIPIKPRPLNRQIYSPAKLNVPYDSGEVVLNVAVPSRGTCLTCGGARRQAPCRCH
jgi:hypothetical protein